MNILDQYCYIIKVEHAPNAEPGAVAVLGQDFG